MQCPHHKSNQTSFVLYTNAKQKLCISARSHFPYARQYFIHREVKATKNRKKSWERRKKWGLKTHTTTPSPSPHANLSSIIQHKRDNRQTARGHLQRAGCQGRPVERAKACPHQSPAAVRATEVQLPRGLQWNSEMEDSAGAALAGNMKQAASRSATGKAQERRVMIF